MFMDYLTVFDRVMDVHDYARVKAMAFFGHLRSNVCNSGVIDVVMEGIGNL